MDKFVTITKGVNTADEKFKKRYKYSPYPIPQARQRQVDWWKDKKRTERILAPLCENSKKTPRHVSSSNLTKHLLSTLKEPLNPITHSTAGQRSDHVDSCSTGHQRSDGQRRPAAYFKSRKKLEDQYLEKGKSSCVLEGAKVYIGGYMSGTTDIEMKRIITGAGGRVMLAAAGATHILTSQGLSGSKMHKHLHTCSKNKVHVVRPEWVLDSIATGKRKREWDYAVIKDSTVYKLDELGF